MAGAIYDGSRTPRRALSILIALAALMALATPAWAPPDPFDASITPSSASGGTSLNLTFTITNLATSIRHQIGSANVTIPAGFTGIGSPVISSVPTGKTWTAALNGNVIELRSAVGSKLAPNESVAVSFGATTPCTTGAHVFMFTLKKTNDFSGTGNEIITGPTEEIFTVSAGCAHHVAFGVQPVDHFAGDALPDVTVRVEDSNNQLLTTSSASITIALGNNPGGSALYGSVTQNASGGIATFSGLVLDKAGIGYTLVASSTGLASDTSDPFDITGVAIDCSQSCPTSGLGTVENNLEDPTMEHLGISITTTVGTCADVCFLSIAEVANGPGDCLDNPCAADHGIRFQPPSNATGVVTFSVSCDKKDCSGTGVANFVFYFEDDAGVISALENCPRQPTAEDMPCITHRRRTGVGDLLITVIKDPSDPLIRK